MVASRHEASHRIFQDRPELLSPVFDLLGVPLPAPATVDVLTPDATEIRPLERRVDSVLHIRPTDSEADGFLLAIEAQGRRADDKPLGATDGETTDYFTELLEIGLGEGPARETWRKLMKAVGTYFPGRGTIVEESYLRGISDGMAEARRQTLLRLLDKRGVPVSETARTRIADCTDADVLDRWLDRAFTVTDAADLFTEA